MRGRILFVLLLMVVISSTLTIQSQNLDATATAIIEGATQTALAESNQPAGVETQDPFQLTATALIKAATQTAEAFTGATARPITVVPQSDDSFELTATALVEAATQQAAATAEPLDPEEANAFALSSTFFIFAGLIVALIILGIGVVVIGQRSTGKRG